MMAIFALFGSYFAGALSEEERKVASPNNAREGNFCPRRSARWLNTIDEGDDSESDVEPKETSDDVPVGVGSDAKNADSGKMVFSEEQMIVIQSAIEELLSKQTRATRASGSDTNVSIGIENQDGADLSPKDIADEESSDFHPADEDDEFDEDENDEDGFLVGFHQR